MPLLRVDGAPTVPAGKTLVAATLTVVLLAPYADGSARYPERWEAEWDTTNNRWKPRGAVDGTLFYVPGGASGQPEPPLSRCQERQAYSDGTVGGPPAWEQRIYQTAANVWAYRAAPPGALVIADPSLPANALAATLLGAANGVAPLGADSKVPAPYLPSATPEFAGASVNRSSAQSISNATFVAISWQNEVFDRGGYWDVAQPTRFTVPGGASGYFDVYFAGEYDSSGVGQRQWLFRVNGSSFLQIETHGVVGGGARSFAHIQDLALSAGDYIECVCYQDSGGARNFFPARASFRKVG